MSYIRGKFTIHDLKDLVAVHADNDDYEVSFWCPDIRSEVNLELDDNGKVKYMKGPQRMTAGGGHSFSHPDKELCLVVSLDMQKNSLFTTIDKLVEKVKTEKGEGSVEDYRRFVLETMLEEQEKEREVKKRYKKKTSNE